MITVKIVNKHIQRVAREIEEIKTLMYDDQLRHDAQEAQTLLCAAKKNLTRIRAFVELREKGGNNKGGIKE